MIKPRDLVIDLTALTLDDLPRAGGKAVNLARLARAGLTVPQGFCITTAAYDHYLNETGIRERLPLLLERKAFAQMRWEELWDLALKVRHLFLQTPLPQDLSDVLAQSLFARFDDDYPLSVRSTAPAEDTTNASFAGLHDSFVHVRGLAAILDKVRLVWASLWSDRALLYRQELSLDPATSSMAVLVQELIEGTCSGVAFSRCPGRPHLAAIEAVWGLNQGLVDGDVEPDRILFDASGQIVERHAPQREQACRAVPQGVVLQPLPTDQRAASPLSDTDAGRILALLRQAENHFGAAQDVEWTLRDGTLFALQARPITASGTADNDERAWYLSLHKSLATLAKLRRRIEDGLLPAMEQEARRLGSMDLTKLDDEALAAAIRERQGLLDAWEARYRDECIPMAHGIRLFGQLYNDRLRPEDPFAFLDLLAGDEGLLAVQRNRALQELAARVRANPQLAQQLRDGRTLPTDSPFVLDLHGFTARFGTLSWVMGSPEDEARSLAGLILELAKKPPEAHFPHRQTREDAYRAAFSAKEQALAREVLDIGRASYRLRDNDNLFIGGLSARLHEACREAERRLAEGAHPLLSSLIDPGKTRVARRTTAAPFPPPPAAAIPGTRRQARQLVGQPAGPGLAQGHARVIRRPEDLRAFQSGEILVCDAVDPNMTFVVPLAGGIVERRGGMLIHGAIIAREYGLACVTGVPGAIDLINTGDRITVDGYLGLVTVEPAVH
ncbi:PEP/pyruvate-binding domain-containing protein [Geoalkalibacter sp.]|uniref:PEP/pyruvate-binding domain-containing protein n=1 Tax=Geoalkalibacter sp. TaxID=3041440 RepID=UPI00272EA695|nr:PEP/pyruvate-binding domain-containing protein [Geoalkalibacter sp.]